MGMQKAAQREPSKGGYPNAVAMYAAATRVNDHGT